MKNLLLLTLLAFLLMLCMPPTEPHMVRAGEMIFTPAEVAGEECCESWGGVNCIDCCASHLLICENSCELIVPEYQTLCYANCFAIELTCEPACIACSIDDPF